MRLLGITGYAGSGKDEACRQIGWRRLSFADPIKMILDPAFPVDMPKELRRPTYVAYGDGMRRYSPNYWLNIYKDRLEDCERRDDVCTPDVRYTNEAKYIVDRGGLLVWLVKPSVKPANKTEKASIKSVIQQFPHAVIVNNGTTEDLGHMFEFLIERHFGTVKSPLGFF